MTLKNRKLADDCFLHDKDRLKHNQALEILRSQMRTIADTEEISLEQANGRILAKAVSAPRNIPAFDNAAVDGYAFAHADYMGAQRSLPLSMRITAGETQNLELPHTSTARIFTGAKMPQGADTVAMQEDCETLKVDGVDHIAIPEGLKKGANCRLAGEDVSQGEVVGEMGLRLRPQDIAALASTGTDKISVYKPIKIAILSSGNEVLRPGQPYESGKVYDANQYMLQALIKSTGGEITDLGVSPDNAREIEQTLKETASTHDVIISTGGASKGEEDHFVDALDKVGKRHLWQLAVKPGRPMCFGQIQDTLCFTLPGNPVAAFVCFLLYVRPSLLSLSGAKWHEPARYPVLANFSIKSKPDRREFLRGFLVTDDAGQSYVQKFDRDGSGLISGLRASTGLIEISEETTAIKSGELVQFIPYSEFGII